MKHLALSVLAATVVLAPAVRAQAPASAVPTALTDCASMGDIKFVCGQVAPEDLVHVPGTDWVVASSLHGKKDTGLRLISISRRTSTILYPSPGAQDRLDRKTYGACPGPLAAEDKATLDTHGLAVRQEQEGLFRLYAVHHGKRESIEVFALDLRGKSPSVTWIGCVVAPDPVGLNSVVGLPDGGFIATYFVDVGPGELASRAKMNAGQINGDVREWSPGKGWSVLPGSQTSGANGVDVSKDGKWVYVAAWGGKSFFRLSRGQVPPRRDEIPLGFHTDNVRLGPDGMVYAGGQGDHASRVVKIDPVTLKVTDLINQPDTPSFGAGTVGIPLGGEIWVGSYRGDRIAIFPTPR